MFEGIKGALQLAAIDMILVFIILGGLALVMVLLKNVVSAKTVKPPKDTKREIKTEASSPAALIQKDKDGMKSELVAVITAAIASTITSTIESEIVKLRSEFKIIRIKKYRPFISTPWSAIGRQEAMLGKNIKY